jgi:hypoxanthine phosphoribosyltransferase
MSKAITVHDKEFKEFISAEKINASVCDIAARINTEYADKCPLFISVLNGSFIFTADLLRIVSIPCELTFIKVTSYQGTTTSGVVNNIFGLNQPLKDRHIIIVEDIVDTGITINNLIDQFEREHPASIKVATALFKPNAYQKTRKIDFVGLEVGNEFLIGYGLDYNGLGRNISSIYKIVE